jgi:hypothetical protein
MKNKYLVKFTLSSNGRVGSYGGAKITTNPEKFKLKPEEIEEITGFRHDLFFLSINDVVGLGKL